MKIEKIEQQLKEMPEQYVFEISGKKVEHPDYLHLYFFKINENRYLACDSVVGFLYGDIIPENYMNINKTIEMINGYIKLGYEFIKISDPKFPRIIE